MTNGYSYDDSGLVIFEADASKFVPRKITDPKELERIRKLVADLENFHATGPHPPATIVWHVPDGKPPVAGDPPPA